MPRRNHTSFLTASAAAALIAIGATCAMAQSVPKLTGPAGPAATAFLLIATFDCSRAMSDEKKRCRIAETLSAAKLLPVQGGAVLFAAYQADPTGNAVDQLAVLFRDTGGGHRAVARNDNVFGADPRDATLVGDVISYTSASMQPGDARCCPTGRMRLALQIEGDNLRAVNEPTRRGMANEIRGR